MRGSTQLPLQLRKPALHVVWQEPLEHACPRLQAMLHPPQLRLSLSVLAQKGCPPLPASAGEASPAPASPEAPPHWVKPRPQDTWHMLPEQTDPVPHRWVQPPQFAPSMVVSTQLVPHFVVPPPHERAHWPAEQT